MLLPPTMSMSSTPLLSTPPSSPSRPFTSTVRSSSPSATTTTTTTTTYHLPQPNKLAFLIDRSKSIHQILQIHAVLLRHNLLPHYHPVLNFKLQRSYASLGRLRYSVDLFNQTTDPNIFLFTAIINAHSLHGLHDQAFLFYVQMLVQGVHPNEFTLSSILKSCSLETGKVIHSHAVKMGFGSDVYVRTGLVDVYARGGDIGYARKVFDSIPEKSLVSCTAMITCYAKHGELKWARELFDGMEERDAICWNVMIDGYAQHGMPTEALVLFRKMLAAKVRANEVTFLAALSACGQIGALESGRWLHAYIENHGIRVDVRLGTALIDMYSKCGSLEDAQLVFDRITDRDVVAWNSMIVGYAMHGFIDNAMSLFDEMCRFGLQPTDITFIGILSACAHAGLVNKGWRLFNAMKDEYSIEPKVEHYGCMVNLLGRAGHLQEAYELAKNMMIDTDPVLWGALLGACRQHGNIAMGKEIAEFLVSHNLANSGTYVLLSNLYAAAGNWDRVAWVRSLMKESGVEKEPGCSSVEVNNKVHVFSAGDLRHPKSKEIYKMLEEINHWLKAHGYSSHTDIVLHDIDEEKKEQSLGVHSEKLAIAFGLVSSQPGTTIKIVKNLRVCADCHAVTKLISKITGRKIVMRDRNRFHHFENGLCSCGDYW